MISRRNLDDWSTIALFLAALATPLLFGLGREDAEISEAEGRTLAQAPEWTWDASMLETWPPLFEDFYNDQFPLRAWILPRYQLFRYETFGISPTDEVIVGEDGWLYLTKGVEEFYPLAAVDLKRFARSLDERYAWLQERGVEYLFVAVPDKADVYPEHMPIDLQLRKKVSRIDEFSAAMARRSAAPVLDLAPIIRQAKSRDDLYYRNDPHWNFLGSYIGYEAIIETLADRLPGLRPVPYDTFDVARRTVLGGGLARMMGLDDLMTEQSFEPDPEHEPGYDPDAELLPMPGPVRPDFRLAFATERPGADRVALVFRDSFATALVPYLSETFARVVYVWERPSFAFLKTLVEREQPDVVIEERVSRFLSYPATVR